jgi:myo-inositol-1(or 4)-monophosphatase
VFDAYWELKVRLWDIAAGVLIAQEAGAVVHYLAGKHPYTYDILCSAPTLYGPLLQELLTVDTDFSFLAST